MEEEVEVEGNGKCQGGGIRWLATVNLCDAANLVVLDQLMNVTGVILLESTNPTRTLCQVKKDATGANATNEGAEGTSTKVRVAQTPS